VVTERRGADGQNERLDVLTRLGVKAMNTDHDNPPTNRDNAGTPETFKTLVIAGARGKGGTNYTGTYSGSAEIE
jgi:hypothetical protein